MREKITIAFAGIVLIFMIPYVLTILLTGIARNDEDEDVQEVILIGENDNQISLEDYVLGVIVGQISSDSELEAIKSQAVIIRTYTLNEMEELETNEIENLSQSYMLDDDIKDLLDEDKLDIYKEAVEETKGEVILYKDRYIKPVFHAVSVGMTESSENIFGKKLDYLVSVDSGFDVEAPDYVTNKEITLDEFNEKLNLDLEYNDVLNNIEILDKTELGYIKEMKIENLELTGNEFRDIFKLNSTNFYIEEYNDNFRIVCLGKGCGVGLSQFGANIMAKDGKNYDEILKYYFPGIVISTI